MKVFLCAIATKCTLGAHASVLDIFITIFVIFVLPSRHAQEIFVSLMNLISKKPFFTLRTPTFDFIKASLRSSVTLANMSLYLHSVSTNFNWGCMSTDDRLSVCIPCRRVAIGQLPSTTVRQFFTARFVAFLDVFSSGGTII